MPYEPFHDRFPEIAEQETRTLIAMNVPGLPAGAYTLIEAYCNEPGCDCRRVMFNVYSEQKQAIVAVIAYGWESRDYYREWFGQDHPSAIDSLKGPEINSLSRQTKLAPLLLEQIKTILQDQKYVARIQRHYKMFRETVDQEARPQPAQTEKIGRNDPCPCGSGRKYKRCCGKPGTRTRSSSKNRRQR